MNKTGCAALVFLGMSMHCNVAAAEGLKPIEYTLSDGTVIHFYGQINVGVLHYDDGRDDFTNFVDNDNSDSLVGIQVLSTSGSGDWKFDATLEAEYAPLSSGSVSQLDDTPDWDFPSTDIRKAEVAFSNERFGKLWLGQGSMASDGSSEVDNSGTSVIAYASVSDSAAGYFFRFEDDGLSDVALGDAYSDLDGLGREFRVRYDTPAFHGFVLSTSYGEDALSGDDSPLYDVAATYDGQFDLFDLDGAIAFSRNEGEDVDILSGSVSGLHKPSGLSLTVAAAREFSSGIEGRFGYVKLGYQREFFEYGNTALSIDYYSGDDISVAGAASESVGLAAVQYIDDLNLQLWMLWRNYHYDDANAEYDDGDAVFGGALFTF